MRFKSEKIQINNNDFNFVKILFSKEELDLALKQANLKSKHTMNANQAGEQRTALTKINKQFQGILAEIAITKYLEIALKEKPYMSVLRYDSVRTDNFQSSINEYDIKIVNHNNNNQWEIESRSSVCWKKDLHKALKDDTVVRAYNHIIGSYQSKFKNNENQNDFYIRPLFHIPLGYNKENPFDFTRIFKEQNKSISLYLISGCHKSTMFGDKGFKNSLSQNGTEYQLLKYKDSLDMSEFTKKIRKLY